MEPKRLDNAGFHFPNIKPLRNGHVHMYIRVVHSSILFMCVHVHTSGPGPLWPLKNVMIDYISK